MWDTSELNHLVITKELSNLLSALPIQSWRMACFGENGLLWWEWLALVPKCFWQFCNTWQPSFKKQNKIKKGGGAEQGCNPEPSRSNNSCPEFYKNCFVFIVSIFRVIFHLWQVILVFPLTGSDKNFHLKIIDSAKNKNNNNGSILRRTH